jgi:hypothetical protein
MPQHAVAEQLIKVLIEHGTDSFFYFDQAKMTSDLDVFYTNPASSLRYDTGFVCLALAAFALGSQWTALDISSTPTPADGRNVDETGKFCYEQARSLVPDLDEALSLHSVQAPLILGVYLLPARATGSLHMYMGLALRKAMALDLHTRAEDATLSEHEREVRCRLWWSVFSLERLAPDLHLLHRLSMADLCEFRTLTVKLNRPRSVDPSIITASLPQPLQSLDTSQSFDNSLHQTANARLTLILDQLSDSS